MDEVEWRDRVAQQRLLMKTPTVIEVLGRYESMSRPLLVLTDDEREFFAKPLWATPPPNKYQLGADLVVGRLGNLMTAPVATVQLLRLHEWTEETYGLEKFVLGFCHGSERLPKVYDSYNVERVDYNKERFAKMALLYGWTVAQDHQYQYQNSAPYHVFSCDHGEFLTASSPWGSGLLDPEFEPKPRADDRIVAAAGLTKSDLSAAAVPLKRVEEEDIINIVAAIPEEWGIPIAEREILRKFLIRRRNALLESYA